ncbi:MAG TPA: nucleotidyltransferase family protein [Negativicutes bacterium]|jgi:hypothetical protein
MKRNEHEIDFATIRGFLMDEKPRLQREYHIKEIGIFGSYVRGEQRKTSDIDILVSFDGRIGGFQYITLKQELSEKFGRKVHISSKEYLKPGIGKEIEREVIYI